MSVGEVSEDTRIRESIIRGIEADDYSACGGDFYARGHIRAIAQAVGTDPRPLIEDYDAARRAKELAAAAAIEAAAATSSSGQGPRRVQARRPQAPAQGTTRPRPVETVRLAPSWRPPGPVRSPRRINWTFVLALLVVVAIGLSGYLLLTGGSHPAKAGPRTHAHVRSPGHHGRKHPRPGHVSPAPVAVRATPLTPASIVAFGPGGTGTGDDPEGASLAAQASPASAWHTDWYATATFGGLQSGTGLLIDLGHAVALTSLRLMLGEQGGVGLELRAGDSPVLADLPVVASAHDTGGSVQFQPAVPVRARYVLIWLTRLPADSSGTFQASIYDVRLAGQQAG
jgi:hypothetical protein